MRKIFRRLAIYVVTAYGNRIYRKAVKAADKRHETDKEMIYVSNGVINGMVLRTYNRKEFRKAKRLLGISVSKDFNISALKAACWYHTANRAGTDGMTKRDKKLRRLAFIKTLLRNARLVD